MSSTTAQATSGAEGSPAGVKPDRRYGVSSLLTACRVMWRGSAPAFLAITVNAIIQALLTWWNPQSGLNVSFVIAFLVSLVSMVAFLAVVTRVSLDSIDGKVTVGSAIAGARRTLPQFALWLVAQWFYGIHEPLSLILRLVCLGSAPLTLGFLVIFEFVFGMTTVFGLIVLPFYRMGQHEAKTAVSKGFIQSPKVVMKNPTGSPVELKEIGCGPQFCGLWNKDHAVTVPISALTWSDSPKPER